jgi:tetratricopeptide (TPR) repeat protein
MSAFDLMDDFDFGFGSVSRKPSLFTFMPKAKAVTLPDANGTETKYWQFDFVRRFTAQKTGSYQFGPVNFQGDLAVGFENGRLQGEAFFANAKALTVNVVPPPEKGRPDDYLNAVGLFDMTASATPDKVKVGDPITLTLRVRGSGSFEDMTAPKLESIPAFADNFKIYESTDKLTDGQMEFSWSMRPLNDKVREIPAITASFFNVDTGQYFQMKTNPIPLTVEKGSALLMSTPSVPNAGAGSSDQNWKTSQGGVHANVTDVNQLRESPFNLMKSPAAFIWTNGIVYGAFIALSALILLVRMMKSSPVQVRRRHAAANALSTIRQAKSLNTPADRLDAVVKAITSYAADRQNVPAAGLTTDDVIRLLRQDGCNDESVLNDARSILQMADAARFGGLDVNVNVPEKAEKIIMKLREFKSSPRVRSAQFVLLAVVLTISGCSQPLSSDEVKQFQKGLDEFAQAQKPDDYLSSAQTYLNLVNQGVKSGAVYYNLGNAYAMAGDKPRALAAYRQAVPYMPSNPHLLDNIQSVGGKEQAVPLFENLFFWQNWISLPNKAFIATILSILTTLTLLAYLIFGKRPILYVGIVFVLLTVCSFVSVQYDYQRFVQTQHGVVTASKVVARKGDADTYAPALTQPLTAGVEFTVSQKRGDWLLINLDDSHEGWIPASSAIVY